MALFGKMDYLEFLKNKRFVLESSGFDIDQSELNPMLYDFQKDIVRWALKKGKACKGHLCPYQRRNNGRCIRLGRSMTDEDR